MPGGVRKQRGRWMGLWYEDGVKKSKVLGLCSEMTKTEAREAITEIVKGMKRDLSDAMTFRAFVEGPYFDFYTRKWKASTAENNKQRIRTHLVTAFGDRELKAFKRDELQDLLDAKGQKLSFSVVDHLRWDMRQIFEMAIAEGHIRLNPAALLFTPKDALKPTRLVMTVAQVKIAIASAEVTQRVYRGKIDTPKTDHSVRKAALTDGVLLDLESWRSSLRDQSLRAFVFPSERGTALSKDNVWRRNMQPKLEGVGLEWCNFQVMRRTHATLMRQLKADPKAVADQLGHSVDVSLNVYAQSPVEVRRPLVNQLESLVIK
jgi:site-specific recombinase XerD